MNIEFVKTSPTQNVTVLVLSPVPLAMQPEIAGKLLAYDGVGGEQVGFLEESQGANLRLQMMGGEFCGNASMATGAYLAWKSGLPDGAETEYPIEVSGADEIVKVGVRRVDDHYLGRVNIPAAERIQTVSLTTDSGTLTADAVIFPGITHLILPKETEISEVLRRIREWNGSIQAEALGALIYDPEASRITPIVYVPAANTVVQERGCGSGTAAIGCYCAVKGGSFTSDIQQPGGTIRVTAKYQGGKFTVQIEGKVKITAKGIAYV